MGESAESLVSGPSQFSKRIFLPSAPPMILCYPLSPSPARSNPIPLFLASSEGQESQSFSLAMAPLYSPPPGCFAQIVQNRFRITALRFGRMQKSVEERAKNELDSGCK